MRSRIASDPGDPVLNASVLMWNATTVPFSSSWWNAPHYYPAQGVSTFTENLAGISPLASPIYWLTANPILAYNLSLFLTWPLSAFAAFLLVRFITKRDDAAFLAGLSFAFTPIRAAGVGHLQTLASFGVPLFLLGLHGFLEERRWPWLALFAAAWLQQSLANSYYILYGAVLIGCWLAYYCSRPAMWKPGAAILATWAVASAPLIPILLKYREIHEQYGLVRSENEILFYSATPQSWFEVSEKAWLWRSVFPPGKDNLFPGLTAVALIAVAALVFMLRKESSAPQRPSRRWTLVALSTGTALSVAAILAGLALGSIDTTIAGIHVRMTTLNRALVLFLLCGIPLTLMVPRTRQALAHRSPLVFYAAATVLIAILCLGPVVRVGEDLLLSPAPYGWLMALPGFGELRVVTQFKMIGVLCLSVAAGLAYASLRPARARAAIGIFAVAVTGLLLDGWMAGVEMAAAPELWAEIEPADRAEPVLELPLGPDWDHAATFRGAAHHRRVLNGVSGYDPPHYVALAAGLEAREPAVLAAIASLGAYDIVVNRAADPDGTITRYAANAPGAVRMSDDGTRVVYRVPRATREPPLGAVTPIARVEAVRHDANWSAMHDGRIDTGWGDYPQKPDQWITIDLGSAREVGGLTHAIGDYYLDFPRRLAIDVSVDAQTWERAWEGSTAAQTFLAYVREPRVAALRFTFPSRQARFVRLRQLESHASMWRVSELQVHVPLKRAF